MNKATKFVGFEGWLKAVSGQQQHSFQASWRPSIQGVEGKPLRFLKR